MNPQFIVVVRIALNELRGCEASTFNGDFCIMVEVEVLVKNVEAMRLSDQPADETSVTFDVAASLAETEHQAGQFRLKYTIAITSQPPVARMDVAGTARITGEVAEVEALL